VWQCGRGVASIMDAKRTTGRAEGGGGHQEEADVGSSDAIGGGFRAPPIRSVQNLEKISISC
jgi:hypothetical protein